MTQRASKFTTPPPPAAYVARPRLETRLNAAATTRLTVVSGRAGSGKTALLSSWISTIDECDRSWLTLDEDDDDAATFCTNVETAVECLTSDPRHTGRDAYLVLDDAHVITTADARRSLSETVAIAPPFVHVIVACRGQLPLSLWRVRTRGELVEIDDDDLRLDVTEAAAIVSAIGGNGTRNGNANGAFAQLHAQTDGWVTGLTLSTVARHSSVGAREATREYLLEEVFSRQAHEVQRFLMDTSMLEHVTADLCERVTGRDDAADVLQDLHRNDVFITRLPDEYGTYRLHPQFRAVLRDELEARDPTRLNAVHSEAARWFHEHDDAESAVDHWLAAGDVMSAIRLLPDVRRRAPDANRDAVVRALLALTQPSMTTAGVEPLLDYATALATMEDDATLVEVLDHIDAILAPAPDAADAFRAAFLRGLLHLHTGDIEEMVGALERAQAVLDTNGNVAHASESGVASSVAEMQIWLGQGYGWLERPRDANRALERIPADQLNPRDLYFRDSARAGVAYARGYLGDAAHLADRAIERAGELGLGHDTATWTARKVNAALLYEHDDLAGAREALEPLAGPAFGAATDVFTISAQIQLAEVLRAEHDPSAALEILFRLRQPRGRRPGSATDNMVRRATVLCLLAIGRIDAARITLGPPPYPDALAITAAIVELGDGEPELASDHLAHFRVDTPRRLLCVSLIRARIAATRFDDAAVDRELRRALRIGRRQGFLRTVLHLAPDLVDRLPALCGDATEADYVATLRRTNGQTLGIVDRERAATTEPRLSARELEVLSYLPTQLSGREIAEALHVSTNTLKTHMQNVYRKLGCDSREAAVDQARRLHFLR